MSDLVGNLVITAVKSPEGGTGLRIDRADGFVLFGRELVEQIRTAPADGVTLDGDLLTIAGTNRTVTYRLGASDGDLVGARQDPPGEVAR